MNLSDFIPTSDQFASIQGIERKLLERRHASILSAAFAILLAVVQLVLVLANKVTLPPIEKLLSWHGIGKFLHSPEGLLLLGLFMAASIFLIVRDLRAHIHIEGDYAIREEDDDDHWTLHVWPRVTSYTPSPENKDKINSSSQLKRTTKRELLAKNFLVFTMNFPSFSKDSRGSVRTRMAKPSIR